MVVYYELEIAQLGLAALPAHHSPARRLQLPARPLLPVLPFPPFLFLLFLLFGGGSFDYVGLLAELRLFLFELFLFGVEGGEAGEQEGFVVLETLLVVLEEFTVGFDALQELSVALLV